MLRPLSLRNKVVLIVLGAVIAIYKLVGQLAANRATVLIRGETGTGKEVIARAIHFNSQDAAEPFIPVNCTAFAPTLLESELFGHVKGAFTGAVADHRGRFALAGRGTIFLDEVGDTSIEFQSKLLRVLEDHEFYPVGGERSERTEARVIAATHRDLEALVGAGASAALLYWISANKLASFWCYGIVGVATCIIVGWLASVVLPGSRTAPDGMTIHTLKRN